MPRAMLEELHADLGLYLARVRAGEDVVVVEGETPIARITPLEAEDAEERLLRLQPEGRTRLGSRTPRTPSHNIPDTYAS